MRWVTLLLAMLAARPLAAQARIDWTRFAPPAPIARAENGFVYDSFNQRFVLFGGYDLDVNRMNDTWEYNAATHVWTNVTPVGPSPGRRQGHSMAYDPVGKRVIVFGGQDDSSTHLGDTWEWNATAKTWTNVTPAMGSPSPRRGGRMVYDATMGGRMILFGGVDTNTGYAETWIWNLSARTWSQLSTTATSPTLRAFVQRAYHGMAFNTVTNRAVIFGGITVGPVVINDIWELNGTVWTDVTPASNPIGVRAWMGMDYDPPNSRIVVYGGLNFGTGSTYNDTWSWNGSAWTVVNNGTPPNPGNRDQHALAFDSARSKLVTFGGYLSDVWELTVNTWAGILDTRWPPEQDRHSLTYDDDRSLVQMRSGGSPELWEVPADKLVTDPLPTNEWAYFTFFGAMIEPPARISSAIAFQSLRKKMLMFGGQQRIQTVLGPVLQDSWEWDGRAITWANVTPGTSPPARYDHAMVYDPIHDKVILFGGRNGSGTPLGDTWIWNGGIWTAGPAGPPARFGHSMTYDPVRGVIVLCCGDTGAGKLNDVWEWNGATAAWSAPAAGGSPPSLRSFAAASAIDSATPGIVVFGGSDSSSVLKNDAYLWDGSTWMTATTPGALPTARQGSRIVYDAGARRAVLYGGSDSNGRTGDVWMATVTPPTPNPAPVSISPSKGKGGTQAFVARFRHNSGFASLADMRILFNTTASGVNAALVRYVRATNSVCLVNDAGTTDIGCATLGSAMMLSNTQVTVDASLASASNSGTDAVFSFTMAFKTAFNGPKNTYMLCDGVGFFQKGTYFVNSGNSTPQMVSVSPASGMGSKAVFRATYRDANGVSDLGAVYFLVNTVASGASAAEFYYTPFDNRIYIRDDADTTFGSGALLGTTATLSNSQVSLDVSKAFTERTATDVVLTLPMTFMASFAGAKNVFLYGFDAAFAAPPSFQQLATFTVSTCSNALTASSNSPVCALGTLQLNASTIGGATYAWAGPNGFTSAVQNPTIPGVTPATAGTYLVTVTVGGCTSGLASTSVTVSVDTALPVVAPPTPVSVIQTTCAP